MIPIRDNVPSRRYPLVVVCLVVANVIVFIHELALGPEALQDFVYRWGVVPERFGSGGELFGASFTLVTSLFIHGGWMHLIGNLWYLWIFGDNVEDRMGHGRFLTFYVLGGVTAAVTHIIIHPSSPVPTVGASGAIAAVLGAYLVMYPGARIITLLPILFFVQIVELPALTVLGFWFVVQLFSGVGSLAVNSLQAQGGIAYWAHVGGFVAGILLLPFFRERYRSRWDHDGDVPWPF